MNKCTLNREIKVYLDNKGKGGKKRFKVFHLNEAVNMYCSYWSMWRNNAGNVPKKFFEWLETEVKENV
jgi:hypothetical protein